MKTKPFLLASICFLLLGIVSCETKSGEQTESTTADNSVTIASDTAMAVDDSYAAEAAALAEKRRIAEVLKQERKDFRMKQAQRFMDDLTSEYMKKLAPGSGEQPQTTITVDSYNEDTETLKLLTTSSFLACVRGDGCPTKESHEFTGEIVIMGDTGKLDYYLASKNSVLEQSETYSKFWNDFGNWLAQKIVEENSKSQE
ncbi:hypothetical protein [Larkinella rosea]|uniref:Uncharacterized protein n=1 Tax=Larkinella rosea TaxID=2025312 RepID=A0A3P1BGP6_9BACT|nr:hypothetical protein [Larkinella rosea]RRB00106.1 hypothetical protein EHT25_26140 [Larkinella rosea]